MASAPVSSGRSLPPTLRLGNLLAAALLAMLPECLAFAPAACAAATSAANIPFSGISPGGVDMATGELILVLRPDLMIDGPFPVAYGRYYASMLASEGLASGHLGPNWLGTYDWTLSVVGSNATLVTNRGAAIRFTQSPVGSWDLVSPTYAKFRLDLLAGGTWRITNPVDRCLYFFDGTSWLLTQVQDEHGNSLSLTYGAAGGLLTQVSDGLGRMLSFTYDAGGHVTQVSDGTRTVHYAYTGGLLTGFTDAAGRSWSYSYVPPPDPDRGLIGVTEPLGNTPVTQAYDTSGRVISQTDAAGNTAMYSYGSATGNLYTDPLGSPWTYQHDASGRLITLMDPMGGPTSFTYDALGRLSIAMRPMGDPTSFAYDGTSGYPSMLTLADGSAINWGYSSHSVGGATFFDLSTESFPDGTTESFGRDALGDLTNLTDQAGLHWLGTYNTRGQLLTWANPSGGKTSFTYDTLGRPVTGQDNAGNTTNYSYDALSRLTQVAWPNATSRTYAYDALDGLTSLTDERGKIWSYAYDENGRLKTETDPLSEASGLVYDALDRVTQVVDPLTHATLYAYDADGRLMTETDRSGRTTSYQYDGLNRLTGVMDPAGGTDVYAYDADSRLISAQDPLGHTTSFGYDMLDRVTHITDPVGTGFDYSYDSMGRLHMATAPLGHTETFNYDARGLLTAYLNATSETDFLRNELGEVSQVTDPNRNAWPRSYDPQGRVTSSADPLGRTTSYEYDALSRVVHVGRPDGSVEQINYDAAGRMGGRQWSDGTTIAYGYDDANRLTSATGASFAYDAAGRMTGSNGFGMTYDGEGRILTETLASGKTVSYSYDMRGLLSQVMDWMGGTTSLSYDAGRHLTGITRPNGTSATYAYDAADRLINAVEKQPGPVQISSIAISRDMLGRPTSIDRRQPLMPGQTMASTNTFAYDAASQMNGVSHDPLGRTTGDASRIFQWDGVSRLTHYAAGADSPRFAYDAFGQVLTSASGSQTVAQAWNYGHGYPTNDDLQVNLPSRTDLCVRTPSGLLLYRADGATGARSFYHYDEAGDTAYLTNDQGSVVSEYSYSPFGGVMGIGETGDNPFTFRATVGMMSLGSSGLWADGGGVYDDRTMRVISGNTTQSGPVAVNPGPIGIGTIDASTAQWAYIGLERNPGPIGSPGDWVALNPQPFPPAPGDWVGVSPGPIGSPGDWVALNPQPFPPAPGSWVGLNPQPFPPGPAAGKDPGPIQIGEARGINSPNLLLPMVMQQGRVALDSYQGFMEGGGFAPASGVAEIYGNDAIVTVGGSQFATSSGTLIHLGAGTLMHEYGHTWGLDHGGPGPGGDGLPDAWESSQRTDFSHGALGMDLNCEGLIEGGGSGMFNDAGVRVALWPGHRPTPLRPTIEPNPVLIVRKSIQLRNVIGIRPKGTIEDPDNAPNNGMPYNGMPNKPDYGAPCLWCPR